MAQERNVCILNDTSEWYHWGCHGSSLGLRRLVDQHFRPDTITVVPIKMTYAPSFLPEPADILELKSAESFLSTWPAAQALLEAEDIIVNGEGTIHGAGSHVKRLLYVIAMCGGVLGKRVHLVNHSAFPPRGDAATFEFYRHAYASAHHVAVRESDSQRTLQASFGRAARLSFDCLPLTLERTELGAASGGDGYAIVTGSSGMDTPVFEILRAGAAALRAVGLRLVWPLGAAGNPAFDEKGQAELCAGAIGAEILEVTSFEDWARLIRDARFLLAGRFHFIIARLCLGGPFIAYGGNTPKIEAMLRDLRLPGLVAGSAADAMPTVDLAARVAFPPRVGELAELARANLTP